jgi:hypothetical protein
MRERQLEPEVRYLSHLPPVLIHFLSIPSFFDRRLALLVAICLSDFRSALFFPSFHA